MQVWVAVFDTKEVEDLRPIYQGALSILDGESRSQVERYYHLIDSFRGLVGRVLIRSLLRQHGVPLEAMTFAATSARKPYVTSPLPEPLGYNITHDNGVIGMVFASGTELYPDPPAYRLGIDLMLLKLPGRLSYDEFVDSVGDQLTSYERQLLQPQTPLDRNEALRRLYLIWTLKEAYTKALGLGLGFDFKRIEYDVPRDVVRIDGVYPTGWKFVRFDLYRADEVYVGVVAEYVGEQEREDDAYIVEHRPAGDWLRIMDASDFLENATRSLRD